MADIMIHRGSSQIGGCCTQISTGEISLVNPKIIIPMHTERPEDFTSIPEFAPYHDRVRVLRDGIRLPLGMKNE